MNVNLEQLRGFVEVARLGHFTRAAERLHLAQPSLSRQISTLEHELGAVLFARARGHISLTPAGEALLPRAQRMLADADAIHEEMAEFAGLRRGRVRLGATPTLCSSLVAEVLRALRAEHPGIEVQITEAGSRILIGALAAGGIDVALVTTSPGPSHPQVRLTHEPLLSEELVVISSAAQPALTREPTLGLDELARLPLIAFPETYDLRGATDAALRDAGLVADIVVEGAEMDAVLRFVERGVGVAVVPAMVLLDRPGLRSTRLAHPLLTRTVSLAHRSDVRPTPADRAMRHVIVETAAAFAAREPATILVPAGRTSSATTSGQPRSARS